ncbi:AsmA family protein [Phaeobacter marinintestinus]|uniref:AsmA family protein n=1 Tax=Falsiphaeobacter marinintestinus TaxID=1492905 RepID=UPI0016454902|nr:AsmA family protein [Phaeobacter marinintestinus]
MTLIRVREVVITTAIFAGVVLVLIWLLAFSRLFAEPRGFLAAQVLSERLAQKVSIDGGVNVSFDPGLHIVVRDLTISGDATSGAELAKVAQISFALDWRNLLRGNPRLSEIHIVGVRVEVLADSDGPADWGVLGIGSSRQSNSLQDIVTDHQIAFSDVGLLYKNAKNGVDLNLQMSSMVVAQGKEQAPWTLQGKGKLNGQALTVDGSFPIVQPFTVTAVFDQINLKIDGSPDPDGYASGVTAKLSVEIAKLAHLLDILKLKKSISGKGTVHAAYKSSGGKHSLDDVKVQLALDGGQSLDLSGDLGELGDLNNATLKVDISLYPPDALPAPAKLRRDLKLTGFEMDLTAQPGGVPLRTMKVQTNGFVLNTHGKGPPPITVSDIMITPDGLLDFGKVGLRIGPPGDYYLVFDGSISDALRLEGIAFDATLDLPMSVLLNAEQFKNAGELGKIVGGFHLSGTGKTLALSKLSAKTQGTDDVKLDVTAASGNVLSLSGISLDLSAEVPSGAKLLSALKLASVPTGDIKFDTKFSGDEQKWQSQTQFSVAQSNLDVSLAAETGKPNPHVDGQIVSDLIRLKDAKHVFTMAREVFPRRAKSKSGGIFSDVTLEPVTTQVLQSGLDMDVKIDLKKLEGVVGTSSVKTDFTLRREKAQLGPVKFEYDGGHFDVTGSVDLVKNPDIVAIKGSADGWNFGTILQELNVKQRGSGVLNANFDLAGAHKSVMGFVTSATGDILISMRDGRIHTRLLDLAGLGFFPWLFSDAHGKVAPIACLRGPLRFDHGHIAVKEAALETDKVQVVVTGDIDLDNETIDVTGEPRPIGKPLSRSPWPFVVSGPLKHPKLGLKKGPHRQHRADGKSTMPTHRKPCIADILQLR